MILPSTKNLKRDLKQWELSQNPYKEMTVPSTQNLKALGLWVFFVICCSSFSFLPNLRLRLILEYLRIFPSSESPSSTLIILPLEGKQTTPYLYRCSHTYTGHAWLKLSSRKLSIQGQTEPTRPVTNHRLWYHLLGKSEGRNLKNETRANPYKRMTPPSTQNLKTLGLWVFFFICCSTFSFLPNVGLRLTLEYLTISSPQVRVPPPHWYTPSRAEANDPLLVPSFTHLNGTRLPETRCQEDFQYRDQSVLAWAGYTNHRLWYHFLRESEGRNTWETNENEKMS